MGGRTIGVHVRHEEAARIDASSRSNTARLQGPDLLRAFAILLVMLLHIRGEAAPGVLATIRPYAWLGVDIFFVLSGYLIGTQLLAQVATDHPVSLKGFYVSRAFRILPAYLVVLTAYALVPPFREAPELSPVWRYLTFTLNLGLDYTNAFTHAWSLCVEEHFYLLFPLIVLLLARLRSPAPAMVLAAAILVFGMVIRLMLWEQWIAPALAGRAYDDLFPIYMREIYYPSYTRADGLLIGVLLAVVRVFHGGWWTRVMPGRRALAAGVLITAFAVALIGYRGELAAGDVVVCVQSRLGVVLSYPLFALGIALVLSGLIDCEAALRRFPVPGAATVAAISYSLYLTHKAVMNLDRQAFGEEHLVGIVGLLVYYGSSLAVAWMLWRLVEQPALALRHRYIQRP